MVDISRSLEVICAGLEQLQRKTSIELLRPGVESHRPRHALQERRLTAPDDLVMTYSWHDGTDSKPGVQLNDMYLFPGFYLLSVEDAVANYDAFRDDPRWDDRWLPVLANGGGDFLAVHCGEKDPGFGQVIHFRIESSDHPAEFSSMGALWATMAAAYDDGVYYVDDQGYLEMDDPAFIALVKRMNEGTEYWS